MFDIVFVVYALLPQKYNDGEEEFRKELHSTESLKGVIIQLTKPLAVQFNGANTDEHGECRL